MLDDSSQPYLLFEEEKWHLLQTQLLDLLLGEAIVSDGNIKNFPSYKEIEEVLFHLETTFERRNDSNSRRLTVKVPSVKLLHILITLAAKPQCGPTRNDIVSSLLPSGDVCLHKLNVRERSLLLLNRFLGEIEASNVPQLYNNIITAVQQIIRRKSTFINSRLVSKPSPMIKKTNTSPRKYDIIQLMKNTTEPIESEKSSDEIVSDSDSEGEVLKTSIEEEVMKFKDYNISPIKSANSRSFVGGKASELFKNVPYLSSPEKEDVKTDVDSSPTKPRFKRGRSSSPAKKPIPFEEQLQNITILDQHLLASQLRTAPNYNVWKLLQWTFICAEKSSKNLSLNYHAIYTSYNAFFHFLIDFLALNLHLETDRLFEAHTAKRQSTLIKLIYMDSRILVLLLMSHLGADVKEWSDRAVEFVFTGLNIKTTYEPQPLYEKERLLLRQLTTKQELQKSQWNDNLDSMSLRYKFLILLYHRLQLTSLSLPSEDTGTEVGTFIALICSKLMIIENPLFEAFFDGSNFHNDQVPQEVHIDFQFKIMNQVLSEMTQLVELYDHYVDPSDSPEEKVNKVVTLIQEDDLYSWIQHDFEDNWRRLNYILVWIMNKIMDEIEDKRLEGKLRRACIKADAMRQEYGTDFLRFTELYSLHFD